MSGLFLWFFTWLSIVSPSVAHKASVFDGQRVVVRPVHKAAKVIPFEHSPNVHAIAHANRHAFGKFNIVGDEQRYAIADINDEALVTGTVVII